MMPLSDWCATQFFEELTAKNLLAQREQFRFCRVSGLEGFEEALQTMQSTTAFICVSDIADGYTELNNTPRTRRVKTIFFAMRHAAENMESRNECMETIRELFRQFMSQLILEKVKLEQNCIYLDPRISFNEIDRYFFSGCACAYFQIAVDVFTDLRYSYDEWDHLVDVWLMGYTKLNVDSIKILREYFNIGLKDAKELLQSAPVMILENVIEKDVLTFVNKLRAAEVIVNLTLHGTSPTGT